MNSSAGYGQMNQSGAGNSLFYASCTPPNQCGNNFGGGWGMVNASYGGNNSMNNIFHGFQRQNSISSNPPNPFDRFAPSNNLNRTTSIVVQHQQPNTPLQASNQAGNTNSNIQQQQNSLPSSDTGNVNQQGQSSLNEIQPPPQTQQLNQSKNPQQNPQSKLVQSNQQQQPQQPQQPQQIDPYICGVPTYLPGIGRRESRILLEEHNKMQQSRQPGNKKRESALNQSTTDKLFNNGNNIQSTFNIGGQAPMPPAGLNVQSMWYGQQNSWGVPQQLIGVRSEGQQRGQYVQIPELPLSQFQTKVQMLEEIRRLRNERLVKKAETAEIRRRLTQSDMQSYDLLGRVAKLKDFIKFSSTCKEDCRLLTEGNQAAWGAVYQWADQFNHIIKMIEEKAPQKMQEVEAILGKEEESVIFSVQEKLSKIPSALIAILEDAQKEKKDELECMKQTQTQVQSVLESQKEAFAKCNIGILDITTLTIQPLLNDIAKIESSVVDLQQLKAELSVLSVVDVGQTNAMLKAKHRKGRQIQLTGLKQSKKGGNEEQREEKEVIEVSQEVEINEQE